VVTTDIVVEAGGMDLGHLHESVRPIAELPADERLGYVRADRWIGYPAANDALQRLETLLAWPAKQRMPNLLLVGPTNNGKSMIIEKFRRTHPVISHEDREEIPVLVVQMPSEPSIGRFYAAVLSAAGAPRRNYRIAEVEQVVIGLLRATGVRMLIIDELHNMLGGRSDRRREFLNMLRFLGNELRIPLVGVGTRDAYLAIRTDDQLENRVAPLTLSRWEPTGDACSLMASFAASFPLRRPSPIATAEMTSYLLTRCEGTIGELPGRPVTASVWFRLLRSLLDEVSLAASSRHTRPQATLKKIWKTTGLPLRDGLNIWAPYEVLEPEQQHAMMTAAATALALASRGKIVAEGRLGSAIQPPQLQYVYNGDRPAPHRTSWGDFMGEAEKLLLQARTDRYLAHDILRMLTRQCRSLDQFEQQRSYLFGAGIPASFLPGAAAMDRSDLT
jgi:hypothetical protein